MSKTILSAAFADERNQSVVLQTSEAGSVAVQLIGQDSSGGWREAFFKWTARGNTPTPYSPPQVDPLEVAEQFIDSKFSTKRLLQMKVWWDTFPHENTPKLAATYQWIDALTRSAIAGATEFSNPPYSFQEIALEAYELGSN